MNNKIQETGELTENQRLLLDLVRLHRPIARSALTDLTNLTQQSVHRLVEGLLTAGYVKSTRGEPSGRGKPSPLLSLTDEAVHALGILINTDSVVLCLVDFNCRTVMERRLHISLDNRITAMREIRSVASDMLVQSKISQGTLCGVGFAMAGFFVDGSRKFNAPEPLRDWSLVDLEPELAELFDVPIFLENSATAGAIGESLSGVGQRCETFAYLSFNYGFGGGIIIDGKPYLGHRGNAGEFSSLFTLEEAPRRPALQYLLRTLQKNGVAVSGIDELRRRFDPSWPGVQSWIDMVMPQMNRMVMALSGILDPEAIVFGGEIAPELAQMLIAQVTLPSEHRYGVAPPQPCLLLSETSGDPAATGAALLPLKYRFFR